MDIGSAAFWAALGSIVLTNIVLSGDNAVVIAMAARSLPPHQQRSAVVVGSAGAIVLRVALTLLAAEMLTWPYLKIIGAALLLYIGVSLMRTDDSEQAVSSRPSNLAGAVRTILVADLVMSLDNVLAVAAAAQGDLLLLVLGLGISIPLIVFGSTLLITVLERLPLLVVFGAGLLGYLAGEMLVGDPALTSRVDKMPEHAGEISGGLGATLVVGIGLTLRRLRRRIVESAPEGE